MSLVEIKVPALGESVSEAIIAKWLKKVGEAVVIDEVLVELETDKVTLEITAPSSGVLSNIHTAKGEIVKIGALLGNIDSKAITQPAITVAAVQSATAPVEPAVRIVKEEVFVPQKTSNVSLIIPNTEHMPPSVRKQLGDNKLTTGSILTSSLDGRLPKADSLNHVQSENQAKAPAAATEQSSNKIVSKNTSDDRLETRVPLSRLRLRIAERLKSAQNTAAILTTFNEIDMMAVKQLRDRYKDVFEKKNGVKLGFMSFFVKACVQALKEIPMVNSRIEGDEIVTNNYCDIGVAVSAPSGLMVPIIRDAELLDLAGIEAAVSTYGKKAKDGKLTMEEMSGGTFTISNGGVFGSLFSTPIINPPQSAILGMHKIQDRPMAINGHVEIRPMMYVALSYDHRLIDGREAVTFLATIKDCMENPGRFLLDL